MDLMQVKLCFPSFFAIFWGMFDDFSNFYSTFGVVLYFEKICMSRIILCIPVNAAAFFSRIQKLNQTSTLNKCYWNVVKSIRY